MKQDKPLRYVEDALKLSAAFTPKIEELRGMITASIPRTLATDDAQELDRDYGLMGDALDLHQELSALEAQVCVQFDGQKNLARTLASIESNKLKVEAMIPRSMFALADASERFIDKEFAEQRAFIHAELERCVACKEILPLSYVHRVNGATHQTQYYMLLEAKTLDAETIDHVFVGFTKGPEGMKSFLTPELVLPQDISEFSFDGDVVMMIPSLLSQEGLDSSMGLTKDEETDFMLPVSEVVASVGSSEAQRRLTFSLRARKELDPKTVRTVASRLLGQISEQQGLSVRDVVPQISLHNNQYVIAFNFRAGLGQKLSPRLETNLRYTYKAQASSIERLDRILRG